MKETPWITPQWWISRYNFPNSTKLPSKVMLHDTTLRDGEQTPGVVFRKEEKIEIARLLDEFGVERIEAGMPSVSKEDAEAIQEIVKRKNNSEIFCFCRANDKDIQLAADCGVDGVVIEVPSGLPRLKYQFNWSEDEVIEKSCSAIAKAKEHGLKVLFFPYDTSRAEQAFLIRLLTEVEQSAKPDSVAVVDTTGSASPMAIRYLVSLVKNTVSCPVEIHVHSDFGLATANTLAGIEAGAEVAHVCVNGLGERCGNAALEQIIVTLKVFHGLGNYKYNMLSELSEQVAEFSGVPRSRLQPIVGDFAFTREIGMGMDMVTKQPRVIYPIIPEMVGRNTNVVMGKKSGKSSVEFKLAEKNISMTAEQIETMVAQVKEMGIEKKRCLTEDEFDSIASALLQK